MTNLTKHEISVAHINKHNLKEIRELIQDHPMLFERAVMSNIGDDRYSYESDSFEVTDIDSNSFTYAVDISYYEGCKDIDYTDNHEESISYIIQGDTLIFELDETDWDVR